MTTPTQGEHAQTEALRLADALECRTTSWPDKAFAAAELRRLHAQVAALTAAPADYDHGPQSLTVAEAARHVGKWLNERPNRPLDLRDVAMLCAHAKGAPAAGAVAGPVTIVPLRELSTELRKVPYCFGAPQLWALHRNGSLVRHLDNFENDFVDSALLAAAPTPAAQADSITKERLKELLGKPETVHLNMLHGNIAVITMEQCAHLHGEEMQRKWAAADSVLEDAARLDRERICAAIKAEDDYCVERGDYMLDSDLSKLTERGAKAWAGVDPQKLREGGAL